MKEVKVVFEGDAKEEYLKLKKMVQIDIQIICFVLEYGDHNKYNDLFGFKKK
jgi:hypothetical protein